MPAQMSGSTSTARLKELTRELERLQADAKELADVIREVLATMEGERGSQHTVQKRKAPRRK
jgi:hypothetical protein